MAGCHLGNDHDGDNGRVIGDFQGHAVGALGHLGPSRER